MVTARDLRLLEMIVEERVNASAALGRQAVHSVGYAGCLERKFRADRLYTRFLCRIKEKHER